MTAYLLNLADLALTLYALQHGGVELNPLMKAIPIMVAWKVCGVGVLCWMLPVLAKDKRVPTKVKHKARRGLYLCTVVYGVICIHHLVCIGGMLYGY